MGGRGDRIRIFGSHSHRLFNDRLVSSIKCEITTLFTLIDINVFSSLWFLQFGDSGMMMTARMRIISFAPRTCDHPQLMFNEAHEDHRKHKLLTLLR